MKSSQQSVSLQRRIAVQRARLADAKKRVRTRINNNKNPNDLKHISDSIKVINIKKGMSYYNK